MSPAVKEQLENLRLHFDGAVYVVKDLGDRAIVLIDPTDRGPFRESSDPSDAWRRVNEPTLVLLDPTVAHYPRVVN